MAQINKIKWLSPCPFLEEIVHFKDAVGWHPGDRRRKQINSTDICYSLLVFKVREHEANAYPQDRYRPCR